MNKTSGMLYPSKSQSLCQSGDFSDNRCGLWHSLLVGPRPPGPSTWLLKAIPKIHLQLGVRSPPKDALLGFLVIKRLPSHQPALLLWQRFW